MDLNTALLGVYVLLVGAGLWLLLTRRLPVLFALAFLSAVAYSFPLFMGFAMYPGRGGTFTPTSLIPKAYVVNSAILAAILLAPTYPLIEALLASAVACITCFC